ncbi:general substrate transporter [Aspergillus cavernicola]|uniref:General substrate transporter n=1 Tax=Aspergillus cavernicola TaxID=176166 RepID=A0ABR4HSU2_9EURO
MSRQGIADDIGTVVVLYTIGRIFGSLSCIYLGDLLGRRKVIFLTSAASFIGAVVMASSFSLAHFIVAWLVLDVGTGGYVAIVPVWQSGLLQTNKRGAHVVTDGISVDAGITIPLWIDTGFYFVTSNYVSWRFPLAFQVILSNKYAEST